MAQDLTAALDINAAMATVTLNWTGSTRTNYITNPSFETGTTGWTATRGVIAAVTTSAQVGTKSLQFTCNVTTNVASGQYVQGPVVDVVAGDVWTASAYVLWVGNGYGSQVSIQWLAADAVTEVSRSTRAFAITPGAFSRQYITGTAPAGASKARVLIGTYNEAMPNNAQFRIDAVMLEKSGTLGDYFDGSVPDTAGVDYAWTGTADASTSTVTLVTPTAVSVSRVNTVNGTVSPVRNAEPATLVAGTWIGQDYEVPLDDPFYYRATAASAPSVDVTSPTYVMPAQGRTMLKHPGQPALNMVVNPTKGPDLSRPVAQGVFDVLGRDYPVAVSMRRSSARGTLELVTFTDAEAANLVTMLIDGMPLLLSTPSGYGLGNRYIAVADLDEARLSPLGSEQARSWTLPFVTVDRPAGAALAVGNTWADVTSTYSTWGALLSGEGTWAGVVSGVGS